MRQLWTTGPEADKWQDCEAFTDYHGLIAARNRPEAVIIGVPPFCHGMYHWYSAFTLP